MKTMEQFLSEVKTNKETEKEFLAAFKERKLDKFFKEKGIERAKTDSASDSTLRIKQGGAFELDDSQMSAVSGGFGSTYDVLTFNIGTQFFDVETDNFYVIVGKEGTGASTIFIMDFNEGSRQIRMTVSQLSDLANNYAVLVFTD